jgi:hypothetical protein
VTIKEIKENGYEYGLIKGLLTTTYNCDQFSHRLNKGLRARLKPHSIDP